ncbi:MAG: aldolase [Anaerolineae bacterium]|jgi:DhnA family fructose-bisphosphate aldolase class Ia
MSGLKTHRLRHIFADDGKALVVALDHAGVFGLMEGLEDPGETIRNVRAGGADAILTTYGVATRFADAIGDMGLILRIDGGTSGLAQERDAMQRLYDVYDALRIGADAVGSMGMPGSIYESETLPYLADLVAQGNEWNMPVMAEMLPGGFENPAEMWTPMNLGHACRIGAEMGVDFIKTAYSGDVESFRKIVNQVYVPIVVLGGSKSKDPRDLLDGIHGAVQAGASGVAVGRNIWRYPEPGKMTAAIAAIIHEGASVDDALELLE